MEPLHHCTVQAIWQLSGVRGSASPPPRCPRVYISSRHAALASSTSSSSTSSASWLSDVRRFTLRLLRRAAAGSSASYVFFCVFCYVFSGPRVLQSSTLTASDGSARELIRPSLHETAVVCLARVGRDDTFACPGTPTRFAEGTFSCGTRTLAVEVGHWCEVGRTVMIGAAPSLA